jgi:extracellular elastinolytic metalloproteinase
MVREIDSRDFSYNRADASRTNELRGFANEVSDALPGTHRVNIPRVSRMTGSAAVLSSTNAPAEGGSLIDRALTHVRATSTALGFAASEPPEFVPDPQVQTTSSGGSVVHLQQFYHGIPVFEMSRTVRFSPSGEVKDVVGDNISLEAEIELVPKIDVRDATRAAVEYIAASDEDEHEHTDQWGQLLQPISINLPKEYSPKVLATFSLPSRPTVLDKEPLGDVIPAQLVIFYQGSQTRLGWHLVITLPNYQGQYTLIVAADEKNSQEIEILYCQNTACQARVIGKGKVYVHNPGQGQGKLKEVSFPLALAEFPPLWPGGKPLPDDFPMDWIEQDKTSGNSTIAILGDAPHNDPEATLTGKVVDGVVIFESDPPESDAQILLNIFYFCNYMHNFFYRLGFDEAAGNFQKMNIFGLGRGGDPVLARAHPNAVNGTANMLTLAEGESPIMNMGLFEPKKRHTAFDSDVVFHEYVHGVTNRLVGGRMAPFALNQPQSRGMGEGWSDYFALTIQNYGKAEEKIVTGDWLIDDPNGIRMHPYNEKYPGTFGDIGRGDYVEEHNIGEIWCATLMQMNRNLGAELGSTELGHQLGWQIVVDGLKLTPANPSFLDARDAILQALEDLEDAGRLSEDEYKKARRGAWTAFSNFGMGPNASSFRASLRGIVADFELPEDLQEDGGVE